MRSQFQGLNRADIAKLGTLPCVQGVYRNPFGTGVVEVVHDADLEPYGFYSELRTALGFNPAFEAATTAEAQAREASGYYNV